MMIVCSWCLQEAIEAEVRKGNSPESARLARNISHMSMGSDPSLTPPQGDSSNNLMNLGATIDSPYMSKLESVASSAVKAADKVGASLIIVFTNTGKPLYHGALHHIDTRLASALTELLNLIVHCCAAGCEASWHLMFSACVYGNALSGYHRL